jgi:RNA polymerase sigma-70 factor (ECF subfamily)
VAALANQQTDVSLLAATAAGDRDALAELYARHAPWLLLRLQRRCADATVVDEVIQDTFLAVWRGARAFAGTGEVAAWIWGIGIRRLVDALRRRPAAALDLAGVPDPVESSAEERVLLGIEYGDLGGALNSLSPELRAVVQATVLDGLTTREASRLLGIPSGTVKTRMMRARAALREELA